MGGQEMRKAIVKTLKNSDKPLTFSEIADKIGISTSIDALILQAELNHLSFAGVIEIKNNGFKQKYFIS